MLQTMNTFVKTAENLKLCIRERERVNPVLKAKLHTMNVKVAKDVLIRKAVPKAKAIEKCRYLKNS